MLGDIVISKEKVTAQAEEYGHTEEREFAFLVAHSMLHLPVVLLMMANMYWLSAELHNLIFLKYRI